METRPCASTILELCYIQINAIIINQKSQADITVDLGLPT